MAANYRQCLECGTGFYGRIDARFCGGACRQRAYRSRALRSAAARTVPEEQLRDVIGKARTAQREARAAVKRATLVRLNAKKTCETNTARWRVLTVGGDDGED